MRAQARPGPHFTSNVYNNTFQLMGGDNQQYFPNKKGAKLFRAKTPILAFFFFCRKSYIQQTSENFGQKGKYQ